MSATREGKLRFLVATDVAARGIDISHLTHVINADFPETAEQYVHRTGRTGRAGRTGTAISIIGPKDIGNLYMLRLTYKIRPIEKQLPTAGELKTRAETDLLSLFVEAFAARGPAHPDDLSLARRLLTHDDAERIIAGLLRDHLGARGDDVATTSAEKRRARNPEPMPVVPHAAIAAAPETAREAATPRRRPEAPRGRERAERTERPDRTERPERVERTERAAPREAPPADSGSALPGFTVDEPRTTPSAEPPGFLELFVNIGRREGVRTADLELLLSGKGIAQTDMGGIRVRDRMTFISVKKEALDRVTAALAGQIIGGRTVVAELARGRG